MKYVSWIIIAVIVAYIAYESILLFRLFQNIHIVGESSEAFSHIKPNARGSILIVGDSTAVGTGAADVRDSIAGRIHQDFPNYTIENMSISGLTTAGLVDVMKSLNADAHYDLLLVQIGGNDVLRFSPLARVSKSIDTILQIAVSRADSVILMPTGNVGAAPPFSPLVSRMYTARSRKIRKILIRAAGQYNVSYIDHFREVSDDPFLKDPERFYAIDKLHPSGEGYGIWYQALRPVLQKILDKK